MPSIASDTIVDTILCGAMDAFNVYEKLSGGHWIGRAPESFLQASIAMAFKKLKDSDDRLYLTLDISSKRIQDDFKMKIDGRVVKMSKRQRFDLLLWFKNSKPRAIIETKKAWNANSCTNDAKRIRQWISDNNNPISAGYLVWPTRRLKVRMQMRRSRYVLKISVRRPKPMNTSRLIQTLMMPPTVGIGT